MTNILNIFIILLSLSGLNGQNNITKFRSAYQHGLNNTDLLSNSNDVSAINPSIIPFQNKKLIVINSSMIYSDFGIASYSIGASIPFSKVYGSSLLIFGYGNNTFKQNSIAASFSRILSRHLSIGIQQILQNRKIKGNSSSYSATTSIAITTRWHNWGLALVTSGLLPINVNENQIPTLKLGVFLSIVDKTKILARVKYYSNSPISPSLGLTFPLLVQKLFSTIAVQLNPTLYSFGINFKIRDRLKICISDQYHFQLGHWPAAGIEYDW